MMKLIEAIESRKSIRAYKRMPVSKDILEKVIETSLRSPSATNLQPWELYVITGEILDKIRNENIERFLSGGKPTFEEPPLNELFRSRRSQLAKDLFALLGIQREDKEKRRDWAAKGHGYFGAPTVVIIALDQSVLAGTWALLGIGSFVQSFCLSALEYGLGTCISEQGVAYHDIIRKYVHVPDSQRIVISITVGYPDWSAPQNQLDSIRVPLEEVVHWYGD
jgi:nitroreductase